MIRCKFQCTEVSKRIGWSGHAFLHAAKFTAVTNGSPENEKFFASTPGGSLEVDTVAVDVFEPGKEYFLDITEAPESE